MDYIPLPGFLAIALAFSFVAGSIAKDYGRSYRFWFWAALALPFIAHFILVALPDKTEEKEPSSSK